MFDKMKQLMEMKKQADIIKRELDNITTEVNDVPGIRIVISGSQKFQSIEVDESLLDPRNKARFQGDLLRGVNAAVKKSQNEAAKKMASAMPGGLPGM